MSTFDLRVRCPSTTCGNATTIRLKSEYCGKKMPFTCPKCHGEFSLRIPAKKVENTIEAEAVPFDFLASLRRTTGEINLRDFLSGVAVSGEFEKKK